MLVFACTEVQQLFAVTSSPSCLHQPA